ncbi:MAG: hypothetical protein ACKV19_06495 [Verrucomicrobiales bacterium]
MLTNPGRAQDAPSVVGPARALGLAPLIARPEPQTPATASTSSESTPAQIKIRSARASIKADPTLYQGHNELAMALARRARESGNPEYYDAAGEALKESLRLAPDNLEGRRIEIWLLLGTHNFAQALEKARTLNKEVPDDTLCYAMLADAAIEMGLYAEAEKAVQWNFDLRPGEIAGLTRGAYLREIFGDLDGAIEFMNSAYQRTAPTEVEDRAWILTHLAHLLLLSGKTELADQHVTEALRLFPNYHYALAAQARVRTAQKEFTDAVDILREYFLVARSSESLFALAEALQRAGEEKEAGAVFALFEKQALEESTGMHNHNRDLIFYYAEHTDKPAEALRLAKMEIKRRQDVKTLHAYAWALFVNGEVAEADTQLKMALAVGVRDPVMFYHAGRIAAKLGDAAGAEKNLLASLAQAPDSEVGGLVRRALAELHTNSTTSPVSGK